HRDDRAAVGRAGEATGRETERLARRPAEARRVALLVRPDQAVAAALGPALARVEGAVGATGERAAAEAEGDAGGAAEVRAVAVLARLDAAQRAAGPGAHALGRVPGGDADRGRLRTGAAAVALLERILDAVAARRAGQERRVRRRRGRGLEGGVGRDRRVGPGSERDGAVGQRRDLDERLDGEPLVRDDAHRPRVASAV